MDFFQMSLYRVLGKNILFWDKSQIFKAIMKSVDFCINVFLM